MGAKDGRLKISQCTFDDDPATSVLLELYSADSFTCPEGYVKCPDSYCVPLRMVCDGKWDCKRGEDEALCGQ